MRYFNQANITNVQELRLNYYQQLTSYFKEKRKSGKSTIDMKDFRKEYEELFAKYVKESKESVDSSNARIKQIYDLEKDQKLRQLLYKLAKLDNLDVEIIGMWVWISGNTQTHKKELHNLGFHWASKKQMWYCHFDDYFKHGSKGKFSMQDIREKYSLGNSSKAATA